MYVPCLYVDKSSIQGVASITELLYFTEFYIDKWSLWSSCVWCRFFVRHIWHLPAPKDINKLFYENLPCSIREISGHLKNQEVCENTVCKEPRSSAYIADHFKAEEMCNVAVRREPYTLWHVADLFKTQELYNEEICDNPAVFCLISDCFKTQEMCIKAVEVDAWELDDVPDHFQRQGMCDKVVKDDPSSLQYVLDWFVTSEGLYMWHDDYYDDGGDYWVTGGDDEDKFFEWYNGYKKRKAQKAKINEEFLPIAWDPICVLD